MHWLLRCSQTSPIALAFGYPPRWHIYSMLSIFSKCLTLNTSLYKSQNIRDMTFYAQNHFIISIKIVHHSRIFRWILLIKKNIFIPVFMGQYMEQANFKIHDILILQVIQITSSPPPNKKKKKRNIMQMKIFLSWASHELENEYEKWRINEGMNKYSFQMEWVPKIIYDSDIIIIYIRFSNQSKESVKMKSVLYSHSYYTDFFLNPPGCWVSQKSSGKRKQKRREGNLNNLTCSEQFLSSHLSQTAK